MVAIIKDATTLGMGTRVRVGSYGHDVDAKLVSIFLRYHLARTNPVRLITLLSLHTRMDRISWGKTTCRTCRQALSISPYPSKFSLMIEPSANVPMSLPILLGVGILFLLPVLVHSPMQRSDSNAVYR